MLFPSNIVQGQFGYLAAPVESGTASPGDSLLPEAAAVDLVPGRCLGFELINLAPARAGHVAIRISGATDDQASQAVDLRS